MHAQIVLSGEALRSRQIVTVLNSEGRVIARDKPRFLMVWSLDLFHSLWVRALLFFYNFRFSCVFSNQFITISLGQIKSGDTSAAESGSEVEDIASPEPTGSYLVPRLTPVCEEVSFCSCC